MTAKTILSEPEQYANRLALVQIALRTTLAELAELDRTVEGICRVTDLLDERLHDSQREADRLRMRGGAATYIAEVAAVALRTCEHNAWRVQEIKEMRDEILWNQPKDPPNPYESLLLDIEAAIKYHATAFEAAYQTWRQWQVYAANCARRNALYTT